MALTNAYTTLAEVKADLNINDARDDARIERAVNAASRAIDHVTHTRFYTTVADEVRYYTAEWGDLLWPGQLLSVTSLETDENEDRVYERSWAVTDYDLEPFNAALDLKPYTAIRISPNGNYDFPLTRKGVKLTGKFGYCTAANCPADVNAACRLLSCRLFRRTDAPLGVASAGELGNAVYILRTDPDMRTLIEPFVVPVVGGV